VSENVKCIGGKSICVDEKYIVVAMIVSGAKDRCVVYLGSAYVESTIVWDRTYICLCVLYGVVYNSMNRFKRSLRYLSTNLCKIKTDLSKNSYLYRIATALYFRIQMNKQR
jgi:hypothetical protein